MILKDCQQVLYEKFFTHPLWETTMCLQPADQTLSFPKGILKNLCVRIGTLYAPAYFLVIETDTDERAPIIQGRPFLNTTGAVIYASTTNISFHIKGQKEMFSFKNKTTQIPEQSWHEPRKRTNRRNRNKQMWTESAQGGQDRRLKSPFLIKKDDPGVPSIECTNNGYSFQKTLYDTGSDVNIMTAVTYQLLHGTMLLQPTYIRLQVIFRSLTWEKTSMIHPPSLGDRSSTLSKQSSTLEPEMSTCTSPLGRYATTLMILTI